MGKYLTLQTIKMIDDTPLQTACYAVTHFTELYVYHLFA